MKKQIKYLSPHQNGKVFGVLGAVSSLIFLLPMFLFITVGMPNVGQHGNPAGPPVAFFLMMPLFYLVFGYLFVAAGCLIYNFLVKYMGGIEFELVDSDVI